MGGHSRGFKKSSLASSDGSRGGFQARAWSPPWGPPFPASTPLSRSRSVTLLIGFRLYFCGPTVKPGASLGSVSPGVHEENGLLQGAATSPARGWAGLALCPAPLHAGEVSPHRPVPGHTWLLDAALAEIVKPCKPP